ncbi:hypothetical protein V8G54_017913 [Vigna mungo]|uniref:Uncharacterized protein n=1 Tax=Vigna mungo TaxID=3915 RepID=A0AAQ3N8P0_VIGMU
MSLLFAYRFSPNPCFLFEIHIPVRHQRRSRGRASSRQQTVPPNTNQTSANPNQAHKDSIRVRMELLRYQPPRETGCRCHRNHCDTVRIPTLRELEIGNPFPHGHTQHHKTRTNPNRCCAVWKRSRKANRNVIADAMLKIVAASKMRANAILKNEDRFSISKCIKVLDELQGVDEQFYFLALDLFENNSSAREIFISLKGDKSQHGHEHQKNMNEVGFAKSYVHWMGD